MLGTTGLLKLSAIMLLCCASALACRPDRAFVDSTPNEVLPWRGAGGFSDWGTAASGLCGVSAQTSRLDIWVWNNATLKMRKHAGSRDRWFLACLGEDRYLVQSLEGKYDSFVEFKDPRTGDCVRRWDVPVGWDCDLAGSSRSGEYVALALTEDVADPRTVRDWEHPRMRIALMKRDGTEVDWAATLVGTHMGSTSVSRIIPSDDRAFVAVAGWDNGVAMVETATDSVLWSKRPPNEVTSKYVAFSPDTKTVYSAGGKGCVYGMDVRTGKINSRWFATLSGQSEYGHRASSLAVSPDGKWVAAGTGPEGLVWVFRAADGKTMRVLKHGSGPVMLVSFSPDSAALATFVPGTIKIWHAARWKTSGAEN